MSQILDTEALDMLTEAVGADALRDIIELFLGECRELTAVIAAPAADRVAIGRAAHSLKSSAGQLGAVALSEAALAVETAANENAPDLPQLIAVLSRYSAETRTVLAEKLS